MDEFLFDHVRDLKEIEDRLEMMARTPNGLWDWDSTKQAIKTLQDDIRKMIERAEADYAAF